MFECVSTGYFSEALLGGACREGLLAVSKGIVEVLGLLVIVLAKGWGVGFAGVPLAAVAEAASAGGSFLAYLKM